MLTRAVRARSQAYLVPRWRALPAGEGLRVPFQNLPPKCFDVVALPRVVALVRRRRMAATPPSAARSRHAAQSFAVVGHRDAALASEPTL